VKDSNDLVITCGKQKSRIREQQLNGNRRGKDKEEGLESDEWME
jgi:hypothetical protein